MKPDPIDKHVPDWMLEHAIKVIDIRKYKEQADAIAEEQMRRRELKEAA